MTKLFVGNTVNVIMNDNNLTTTDVAPYPSWYKLKVPITIIEEYPMYYVARTEPHYNKRLKTQSKGNYNITIDKVWLKNGTVKIC